MRMEANWAQQVSSLFLNDSFYFRIRSLIYKLGIDYSEDSVNLHLQGGHNNHFEIYLAPGFVLHIHDDSFNLYVNGIHSVSN